MTTAPKRRWFRWSLRTLFVVVLLVAALFIGYAIRTVHHVMNEVVPNCYAVEWVASMVIDYMADHDEAWPRGWDDLRESYENVAKKASYPRPVDYPWSFDELRSRVEVDWKVDPQTLALKQTNPGQPPFQVIWLTDGRQDCWEGREPNQMVLEYLKKRRSTTEER